MVTKKKNKTAGPLKGLNVIDASRVLAGPYCAQLLADLGADVTKIEKPGSGDETRGWGPPFAPDGTSAYYLSINRNKEVLWLDYTKAADRKHFKDLIRHADVLIENFRLDSVEKLGLSYTSLKRLNKKLVLCSISGFGRDSSWSDVAGYDFAIQALSGFMAITGPEQGPPSKVGIAITDVLTALYSANAIQAALLQRQRTKRGAHIDMALMDCAVSAQVNLLQAFLISGRVPQRQGNAHLQIVPYQAFQTKDAYLVLAVGNDEQWTRFCRVAGLKDLMGATRYKQNADRVKQRETLVPTLAATFLTKATAEWERLLKRANIPHAPILDYSALLTHPLATEREWFLKQDGLCLLNTPFHIRT